MIFKPHRWRWVLLLVMAMLLGALAVDVASSRTITLWDLLAKATAYAIGAGIAAILLRTDRLCVEIDDDRIRGPVRQWLWFTSVEAPLADVDLLASRISFWRGSFIRLRTGQKIILNPLFMGMAQIRTIFDVLKQHAANPAIGDPGSPQPER